MNTNIETYIETYDILGGWYAICTFGSPAVRYSKIQKSLGLANSHARRCICTGTCTAVHVHACPTRELARNASIAEVQPGCKLVLVLAMKKITAKEKERLIEARHAEILKGLGKRKAAKCLKEEKAAADAFVRHVNSR